MIGIRDIVLTAHTKQIIHLKNSLRNAALGKAFVLQGGTLAESCDVVAVDGY